MELPENIKRILSKLPKEDAEALLNQLQKRDNTRTDSAYQDLEFRAKLLDEIKDLITATDLNGKIIYVNRAEAEMFGTTREELIGKTIFDYGEDTKNGPSQKEILNSTLKNGFWRGEVVNYSFDNTPYILDCRTWTIMDEKGKPRALCSVSTDITEKKKMEEAMQRTSKLDSLGVLAGGIAHDFNNLLGGIFGYMEIARDHSKDPGVKDYLEKSINTIERARGLTSQLLTFAKGGAPVKYTESLLPFLKETVQFALSGSNLKCSFDIQENLPLCDYDKNQIAQVLENIVINAEQAMPSGGNLEIKAESVSFNENNRLKLNPGKYIRISATDHGIGMPPDMLAKIFDPFFSTKSRGHGLGLATSYSIVARHGGIIDVESSQGEGTRFHIFLPASENSKKSVSEQNPDSHKGSGTILVMDDEKVILDTLRAMLQSFGYNVTTAENGDDLLDIFNSYQCPDKKIRALIFDLTIPGGKGGIETIDEIRKKGFRIPAFVTSGYSKDPAMVTPNDFGFTASLKKPFRKSELSRILDTYL